MAQKSDMMKDYISSLQDGNSLGLLSSQSVHDCCRFMLKVSLERTQLASSSSSSPSSNLIIISIIIIIITIIIIIVVFV
jgi:subtilase family serine protease